MRKKHLLKTVIMIEAVVAFFGAVSCEQAPKTVNVSSVQISEETLELEIDEEADLFATVLPSDATDKTVTWKSSKSSVASVDQTGHVIAKAAGTATISATAGGITEKCSVTVKAKTPVVNPGDNNNTGGNQTNSNPYLGTWFSAGGQYKYEITDNRFEVSVATNILGGQAIYSDSKTYMCNILADGTLSVTGYGTFTWEQADWGEYLKPNQEPWDWLTRN